MKIVVDAMGGDHAPEAVVKGCLQAAEDLHVEIVLVGDEAQIRPLVPEQTHGITIVHASEVISCDDDPAESIRTKKDSSIVKGMRLVAEDAGDAFVSAGSSGAVISGATLLVKRIPGIRRVALATVLPSAHKPTLLLDCGANADCTTEFMEQFALMGSLYARSVMHVENPEVALLNNGAEEGKGSELYRQSYQLLKALPIRFIGNIEARHVLQGKADVVVADGFAGNVFLKCVEGTAIYLSGLLKAMFMRNAVSKLCAALLSGGLRDFKRRFDYTEYGGAPVLGARKVVIKAHGSSNAKAVYHAIRQAKQFVEADFVGAIRKNLEKKS